MQRLYLAGALVAVAAAGAGTSVAGTASPRGDFTYRGTVVRIVDGDTMDVRLVAGGIERVRLIGIDTPERGVCYADRATARAKQLTLRQPVTLRGDATQDKRDRYNRLLAYVDVHGRHDVGRTLIAAGFGKVYVYGLPFKRLDGYRAAETGASTARLGLWSACAPPEPAPLPPAPSPPPPPPTTTTTVPAGNCDPSYPSVCIPPPPPDLDCADVPYKGFTVRSPDPHRFDGDHDGIGCER